MGIPIREIKTDEGRDLLDDLAAWEAAYGDGDGEIELSDIRTPEIPYTAQDAGYIELPGYSSKDLHALIEGRIIEDLAENLSRSPEQIKKDLRNRVSDSSYSGDSAEAGFTLEMPSLDETTATPPILLLGLLGVQRTDMGIGGWKSRNPGPMSGFVEGSNSYLEGVANYFANTPIHSNPDARHQISAVPGLSSLDSLRTPAQMREANSNVSKDFNGFLGDTPQFEAAYRHLSDQVRSGFAKNPVYFESLGANDILGFNGIILPRQSDLADFKASLRKRFAVLTGQEAVTPKDQPHKIKGLQIVRFGISPFQNLFVPLKGEGKILRTGSLWPEPLPQGLYGSIPTLWKIQSFGTVRESEVLTQSQMDEFVAAITAFQKAEKEICDEYGVTLVKIDDYIKAGATQFSFSALMGPDGLHPRKETATLITLARAIVLREQFDINPTPESLTAISEILGVPRNAITALFEANEPIEAFKALITQMTHRPQELSLEQRERMAGFYPNLLNIIRTGSPLPKFGLRIASEASYAGSLELPISAGLLIHSQPFPIIDQFPTSFDLYLEGVGKPLSETLGLRLGASTHLALSENLFLTGGANIETGYSWTRGKKELEPSVNGSIQLRYAPTLSLNEPGIGFYAGGNLNLNFNGFNLTPSAVLGVEYRY